MHPFFANLFAILSHIKSSKFKVNFLQILHLPFLENSLYTHTNIWIFSGVAYTYMHTTYISFRAIVIQNGPHSDRSPRVFQFRMQTTGAAAVRASHRLYLFSFRRGKIISRHEVTYRPYFGARPSSSWNQGQYSTKVVLCERNYLSSWMTRLHCANYSNRSIAVWKISDPFLLGSIVSSSSSCSKCVKFLGSRSVWFVFRWDFLYGCYIFSL